jgi:hypothetical protein
MKVGARLLFISLLLACDKPLAPAGEIELIHPVNNTGLPQVAVEPGAIEFRATYVTSCLRHLTARLAARGPAVVELQVGSVHSVNCFPIQQDVQYVARLSELPSGRYTLRVIHYPNLRDTVSTVTVDVP